MSRQENVFELMYEALGSSSTRFERTFGTRNWNTYLNRQVKAGNANPIVIFEELFLEWLLSLKKLKDGSEYPWRLNDPATFEILTHLSRNVLFGYVKKEMTKTINLILAQTDEGTEASFITTLKNKIKSINKQDLKDYVEHLNKISGKGNVTQTAANYANLCNNMLPFTIQQLGSPREILENRQASNQCRSVIGNSSKTKDCYLCGLPLNQTFVTDPNTSKEIPPECEHLLPVFTAQRFWVLSDVKALDVFSLYKNQLSLEYKWSHKCCNALKSNRDIIFPNIDESDDNFGYWEYTQVIDALPVEIINNMVNSTGRESCQGFVNSSGQDLNMLYTTSPDPQSISTVLVENSNKSIENAFNPLKDQLNHIPLMIQRRSSRLLHDKLARSIQFLIAEWRITVLMVDALKTSLMENGAAVGLEISSTGSTRRRNLTEAEMEAWKAANKAKREEIEKATIAYYDRSQGRSVGSQAASARNSRALRAAVRAAATGAAATRVAAARPPRRSSRIANRRGPIRRSSRLRRERRSQMGPYGGGSGDDDDDDDVFVEESFFDDLVENKVPLDRVMKKLWKLAGGASFDELLRNEINKLLKTNIDTLKSQSEDIRKEIDRKTDRKTHIRDKIKLVLTDIIIKIKEKVASIKETIDIIENPVMFKNVEQFIHGFKIWHEKQKEEAVQPMDIEPVTTFAQARTQAVPRQLQLSNNTLRGSIQSRYTSHVDPEASVEPMNVSGGARRRRTHRHAAHRRTHRKGARKRTVHRRRTRRRAAHGRAAHRRRTHRRAAHGPAAHRRRRS